MAVLMLSHSGTWSMPGQERGGIPGREGACSRCQAAGEDLNRDLRQRILRVLAVQARFDGHGISSHSWQSSSRLPPNRSEAPTRQQRAQLWGSQQPGCDISYPLIWKPRQLCQPSPPCPPAKGSAQAAKATAQHPDTLAENVPGHSTAHRLGISGTSEGQCLGRACKLASEKEASGLRPRKYKREM